MTFLSRDQILALSVKDAKKLLDQTQKKYRITRPLDPELWPQLDEIINQILNLEDHIYYQERYVVEGVVKPQQ